MQQYTEEIVSESVAFCQDYLIKRRILAYVEKRGSCWLWRGATTGGYGRIRVGDSVVLVHRAAYERWREAIGGATLYRTCKRRNCCNPWHWRKA